MEAEAAIKAVEVEAVEEVALVAPLLINPAMVTPMLWMPMAPVTATMAIRVLRVILEPTMFLLRM